jgi:hypothetical protein
MPRPSHSSQFNHPHYAIHAEGIYVSYIDLKTTVISHLYNINWLVFITEAENVLLRGTVWGFKYKRNSSFLHFGPRIFLR